MTERFTSKLAVFVILRNSKQEILLQQRANTGYLDGYWDLPSGHVELGEALRDTAVREVQEEVGVTVKPSDLNLTHIEQFFVDDNYTNFTFTASKWHGVPKICEPEKCTAIGWFSVDDLPDKCVNAIRANQQTSFSEQLTYSITDRKTYQAITGDATSPA